MRAGRWRAVVRGMSLRSRVMAAAALLVVLTSLVTAVLGTTLLRSYLLARSDTQLRGSGTTASRLVGRQQLQPAGGSRPETLPTQFFAEVIDADEQVTMAGGPLGAAGGPEKRGAPLAGTRTPV